ncbi:hypothetical protein [Sulfurimonas autotrophica]|uniref:Uncharacterized protein n=1 Tax=Sulfurimonas autotrophica (strain ATCC BAA-671 / DSM 16294 / JCM 11897 / OK10) TaxID=563040 RepID=E0UT97_SULAO|nr:hypothetical protein [Sulfurimonas autotrophica]ADN08200.1 conserved hypothetical protein [Sulfurimonas autotrophica DSM 16294]
MKKSILFICGVIMSMQLHATDDTLSSEGSHFLGGTALGAGATAVVNQFDEYKQNRKIIGFGISAVYGVVDQTIQYIEDGNAGGQLLDLGAHLLGSALGAWVADEYILSPIVQESETEGKYLGLAMNYSF